jgi:8-oxo-dGTP pyrophosphatase MutT (NUDIX family)
MGSGVLPTTIHKGKLYLLFGKENEYEDFQDGYSDFGGGTDNNESFLETAVREGTEEITGFLGSFEDVRKMLKKHGTFNIDYSSETHSTYRTHIFPMEYDEQLPFYYNNNQRFLQKKLDPKVIRESKIFEKQEIRWICADDLMKMRPKFRKFYQNIVTTIYEKKDDIYKFIKRSLSKNKGKQTRKQKARASKTRKQKV